MSLSLKRMLRDKIVDDSAMQTILGVSTTGSAHVMPVFMETSGKYPQIIYSIIDGATDPGMNSQNKTVSFMIEAQATGGVNAHKTLGDIENRLSGIFDDLAISGQGFSGTGIYNYLMTKSGGPEVQFDESRKTYKKVVTYNTKLTGG